MNDSTRVQLYDSVEEILTHYSTLLLQPGLMHVL